MLVGALLFKIRRNKDLETERERERERLINAYVINHHDDDDGAYELAG